MSTPESLVTRRKRRRRQIPSIVPIDSSSTDTQLFEDTLIAVTSAALILSRLGPTVKRQKSSMQALLKPKNGVVGITKGGNTAYFLGTLKERDSGISMKELLSTTKEHPGKMVDFIYDPKRSVIALSYNGRHTKNGRKTKSLENPHGHCGIADAVGANKKHIVGGGIACSNKQLVSNEWSGHYGNRWTNTLRRKFAQDFKAITGEAITHHAWDGKALSNTANEQAPSSSNDNRVNIP